MGCQLEITACFHIVFQKKINGDGDAAVQMELPVIGDVQGITYILTFQPRDGAVRRVAPVLPVTDFLLFCKDDLLHPLYAFISIHPRDD